MGNKSLLLMVDFSTVSQWTLFLKTVILRLFLYTGYLLLRKYLYFFKVYEPQGN